MIFGSRSRAVSDICVIEASAIESSADPASTSASSTAIFAAQSSPMLLMNDLQTRHRHGHGIEER